MVTICGINKQGEGVFYLENQEKSVPFVLPGEVVTVSFDKKGRHAFLQDVIKESPARVNPPCPYFSRCGGCSLQHASSDLYDEIKTSIALNTIGEFCSVDPLIKIKSGQRRRANLEAVKKNGQVFMGFHRLKSHQIININTCIALSERLRPLIPSLRDALDKILTDKQKAQIFLLESDTGIDIALEICLVKELTQDQRDLLYYFATQNNIARLFFRHRKYREVIYQSNKIAIKFEEQFVPFDAYSFAQATKEADRILTDLVISALSKKNTMRIADLFSGRGTFSFALSKHGDVDAFESDKHAIADVLECLPPFQLFEQDLFENPIKTSALNVYDVVVLDPPRAGARTQVLELFKSKVPLIIYVSCNPESFKKDTEILLETYDLVKVTPVDQFVWNAHLELVGIFKKKK